MEKIFFFLYSILTLIIYILSIPFLLLFSFKDKYKLSIPSRFFRYKNSPLKKNGIWFHSCSFGEAKAIKVITDELNSDDLRMTTTTNTGFEAIGQYTKESRFLPFEIMLFGWIRPQKTLVVMEAEFWYLLFYLAKRQGTRTILINARMSDKSYPKYLKIRWFYREIFKYIDEIYAQTNLDRDRLISLGAKNVVVTGNIKLASIPISTKEFKKPSDLVVCGASTHEGEEELILNAFDVFKKDNPQASLILVPRHPQRFDKIYNLIKSFDKYSHQRYSVNKDFKSDIILIDTLGELINIYAISDIVILGGAFAPIGGHNASEIVPFDCKIISGKHYFNQRDIFSAIEGIAIVEDFNLSKRLLQHHLLKPCRLKYKTDISPIIDTLLK